MTPHLEEGLLHELIDGEIASADLAPIQVHLAACEECRIRLEEARGFAAEADRLVETIELNEQEPRIPGVAPLRPTPKRWGRDLAWAATVVLAAGVGYLARRDNAASLPRQEAAAPAPPADTAALDATAPVKPSNAVAEPTDEKRSADRPATRREPAGKESGFGKTADTAARLEFRSGRTAGAAVPEAQPPASATGMLRDTARANTENLRKKDSAANRERRPPFDSTLRLEELVVTGVAEKAAKLAAPAARAAPPPPPQLRQLAAEGARVDKATISNFAVVAIELTLSQARSRLADTLRLIDGLTPLRIEAVGDEVRVVYALQVGELYLVQRFLDGRVTFRLLAPPGFSADSLEQLRARVRE